jgi:glucose/arabinose dehydrogenase
MVHWRTVAVAAVVLVVLTVGGCSSSGGSDGAAGDATTGTFSTPVPSDSAAESTTPVEVGAVQLTEIASVEAPTAMTFDPTTGDLYVAERAGRVVPLDPESGEVGEPLIDISDDVSVDFERGLLGIAIDPDGQHLYLSYTDADGNTHVDAYGFADGAVDESSRRAVFGIDQPFPNHNGGNIVFGPDGYLYLGLGDGGSAGDPNHAGQDLDNLLGKILRIDPSGDEPYAVPTDNPYIDEGKPEIWIYGVRNPWRFSFDRDTGDLWIGDVGQDDIEEIDHLPAGEGVDAGRGANLGWSEMEGNSPYDGGTEPSDHTPPVFQYANDGPHCSVTGGYVYRGKAIPGLVGGYVYGDYCFGELRYLRLAPDGGVVDEGSLGVSVGKQSLASFGEDEAGELYVLSISEDRVYRLDPA